MFLTGGNIMFQESEIINLVVGLIAVLMFWYIFNKRELPKLRFIYVGFFFVLCGYLFTVIEGVFWNQFFNLLEHLCYTLSGISFLVGCRAIVRHLPDQETREL